MKLLRLALILIMTIVVYNWVNGSGGHLAFADLLPFSRAGHSFSYNYSALALLFLTGWLMYARRN
ncbi:MAG: hypothetical protein IPH59_10350 [bacterium]|nr:hypothetical protein [bacterium]